VVNFFLKTAASVARAPFFSTEDLSAVADFYRSEPDAPETPLWRLPSLAAELGIGELLVKDETERFGLPAFKIAGARYAIARVMAASGTSVSHLACATAGNHGRAVARVARERGLTAHVFVPAGTAPARLAALRAEGADVIVSDCDYDAAVALMAREARAHDWTIVSDTAWQGYEQIPKWIMAGYTRIFDEAAAGWGRRAPDVIIVQAGVGSFAGAFAGWLAARFGTSGPRLVVAEPEGSACVLASLRADRRVTLPECAPTAMVGLRCGEVSPVAWAALHGRVDAALAVPEALNDEVMVRLARPAGADPAITAGASGSCGVAALMMLMREHALASVRTALQITTDTRVLAFVTEGNPQLFLSALTGSTRLAR
jgi:diaminopropionate ammonia-lyase